MRKWMPLALGALVVALLLAVTHLWTRLGDQRKIAAAEAEAQLMRARHDSLYTAVRIRDSLQGAIQLQVGELLRASDRLRDQVAAMEQQRRAAQLAVHAIDNSDTLQARFASVFPEYARTFRRTELRDEPTGITVEYGMLPVWGFGAFVTLRRNAESLRGQRDSLVRLDTLRVTTIAMKDSIFALEHQNRVAFQRGYDTAFAAYLRVNDAYVARLKEPRFGLKVPKWQALLFTAAGSAMVGYKLR